MSASWLPKSFCNLSTSHNCYATVFFCVIIGMFERDAIITSNVFNLLLIVVFQKLHCSCMLHKRCLCVLVPILINCSCRSRNHEGNEVYLSMIYTTNHAAQLTGCKSIRYNAIFSPNLGCRQYF